MKILALVSSYRKRGNTARIVEMIEAHLEALAARHDEVVGFETLYLGHLDIQMCRGCRTCFDHGEEKCPLKDDVPAIRARIDEADGVILASPVYANDVNGIAKNWMDRLAYVCHRPAFAGKCAYLVATVADGPTTLALLTMNQALRSWGFHIAGQAGFKMGALMPQEEMESRYERETARVGQGLFRAISRQLYLRPSFLSLIMFKIQQRAWQQKLSAGTLDHAYWEGQGWFDPKHTFYMEHRANRVKVALARLTGAVVGRFVA